MPHLCRGRYRRGQDNGMTRSTRVRGNQAVRKIIVGLFVLGFVGVGAGLWTSPAAEEPAKQTEEKGPASAEAGGECCKAGDTTLYGTEKGYRKLIGNMHAANFREVRSLYLAMHLLNRQGVARLCYCGPVLHTRPDRPHATREPLQFGAEIYGHAGIEADLEALLLALDCLKATRVGGITVDMADVRIVRSLLAGVPVDASVIAHVHAALAAKDASELASITKTFPAAAREGLRALLSMYGDAKVLEEARTALPVSTMINEALDQLKWLARHVQGANVTFDLADLRGYAYYSGARFAIYTPGASDALVRGGRYDEVGAVFGRNRPAVGFSLDVKELASVAAKPPLKAAIRAPWLDDGANGDAAQLSESIAALRTKGETVVCVLPGHESEVDEFQCDRELVREGGQWRVKTI